MHFVEKVEDQKQGEAGWVKEAAINITMKLKHIIVIPIYSFTDKA